VDSAQCETLAQSGGSSEQIQDGGSSFADGYNLVTALDQGDEARAYNNCMMQRGYSDADNWD
jgi:hypothetical protein